MISAAYTARLAMISVAGRTDDSPSTGLRESTAYAIRDGVRTRLTPCYRAQLTIAKRMGSPSTSSVAPKKRPLGRPCVHEGTPTKKRTPRSPYRLFPAPFMGRRVAVAWRHRMPRLLTTRTPVRRHSIATQPRTPMSTTAMMPTPTLGITRVISELGCL